ncbi:MAG TPA: class I lanthipeptide [Kofleriaceae bacterium]|nr:class I lanthipeptide [Kofleriaceae bacterium]
MNKRDSAPRKKLVLNKSTLRHLTDSELQGVGGGAINLSRHSECAGEPCHDPFPNPPHPPTSIACPP